MTRAMQQVRGLVRTGVPFERLEAYVEDLGDLEDDERALLWMFAWAEAQPVELTILLGRRTSTNARRRRSLRQVLRLPG